MSFIGKVSYFGQNASNKMKDTAEIVKISGQLTNNTKPAGNSCGAGGHSGTACPDAPAAERSAGTAGAGLEGRCDLSSLRKSV